ncbi:MAG: preprotein translocase subunit SecA [Lacunisphaera sp.]|nr:preprotein translocase subunit SecA [Lacunisphaera sp.]
MTPTAEILRTRLATPPPMHRGADGLVHRGIGLWRRRRFTRPDFARRAVQLAAEHAQLAELSDADLHRRLDEHRREVRRHRQDCFAAAAASLPCVAEAARRKLGLDPYPEQFRAALALLHGVMAEMATGEGKTLAVALAAAPLAWTGLPLHVLTANDYLARRDAGNLGPFYRFCGLEAGRVLAGMPPDERAQNYAAAVVYTTGKELLADFLRDRLVLGPHHDASRRIAHRHFRMPLPSLEHMVLRGLHYAIVDEADSLMIDEAVTPLIISRQLDNQAVVDAVLAAHPLADALEAEADYTVDFPRRDVRLTPAGQERVHRELAALEHPYWRLELVETALRARLFFHRDKQYVVQDGAVVIVDEFTGRMMPGRQWKLGLHQAVEAREGVEVTQPTEAIAQMSYQSFFRLFHQVSGITGTSRECAAEIWAVHHLPFTVIPRHRPNRLHLHRRRLFATAEEKWHAVVELIASAGATGRPVLVGTRSIATSEELATRLQARGIAFNLLNAVRHREEAQIVEHAGRRGAVTLATNMAGRGTDIRLGDGVVELGGLLVIATEMHRSARIDRQLFGRAARQGDPGDGVLFLSLEDELVLDFLPRFVRRMLQFGVRTRWPGAGTVGVLACRWTQWRAERAAFRQRFAVLEQDKWIQENISAGRPDFGF